MQRETEILFSSFIKSRTIFQYLFASLICEILLYYVWSFLYLEMTYYKLNERSVTKIFI